MSWQVLVVLIVSVMVAATIAVLGGLLARERRKRLKTQLRKDQMEDAARRLLNERDNRELNDEEAAKKLSDLLDGWDPCSPPVISGRKPTEQ